MLVFQIHSHEFYLLFIVVFGKVNVIFFKTFQTMDILQYFQEIICMLCQPPPPWQCGQICLNISISKMSASCIYMNDSCQVIYSWKSTCQKNCTMPYITFILSSVMINICSDFDTGKEVSFGYITEHSFLEMQLL